MEIKKLIKKLERSGEYPIGEKVAWIAIESYAKIKNVYSIFGISMTTLYI